MKFWFSKGAWASKSARQKINGLSFNDIKSIAVLRHAALGDMVLTRSFLIEARKAFPDAKITLSIVSNYTRGVPEDLVDRIHIVHGSDNRGVSISERYQRIKQLGHHDFIFDLASTNRSYLTCLLNPAILKFGFPYRWSKARLFYDVAINRSDLDFEVCDMIKMLNTLGIKTAYPHVYNMPGLALQRDKPYIVYFIGASTPDKCWPADRFTQLLKLMSQDYPDHDHLVLEGIKEWENADRILDPVRSIKNTGVIQSDNINDTVSLLKGADLVVSNDTGIRHLAIVSETPTVGIFYKDPFRYWPRYDIHDVAIPDESGTASVEVVRNACLRLLKAGGRSGH